MTATEVTAMLRNRLSTAAMLVATGLAILGPGAAASLAGGSTVAQIAARIPPIPSGLVRVWWLRQFQPGESLRTPMTFIDDTPLAASVPGTAFYRDLAPGTYTFSVETCTEDVNQSATLSLAAGSQTDLEVQSLSSFSSADCPRDDTFYVRVIPPASARLYFSQLSYLGPR